MNKKNKYKQTNKSNNANRFLRFFFENNCF